VANSPGVNFSINPQEYSYATSFASPILLSAAFDDDLVYKVASIISTEARAFSNVGRAGLDYWTPNINPYKDPRWGRGSETPGEDPFRIQGYVKALISGLQGDQDTTKVIATCKHYAAYDLESWVNPEGDTILRHDFDAIVNMQDLVEYYLPPFQQCARDSKVKSVMCSYNSVNGTPACASTYLMQTVLRDFWGWTDENQYITSDCDAVVDFYEYHNYSTTAPEAAAYALNAGTDTVCELEHVTDVTGAYNQSLLSEEIIDQALRRQYEGIIRAGYFDPNNSSPYRSLGWGDVNTLDAQALALQSAVDGIVLKKNDGLLPLEDTEVTIALIGFWANTTYEMLGGYSGIPPYLHAPVYAAEQLGLEYVYANGSITDSAGTDGWEEIELSVAKTADIVVYFGGNDLSIEAEGLDRQNLTWQQTQQDEISQLSALGKPLVVVELGDQQDDTFLLNNANISAVLWAGYPGQDGGTAVLNILTGRSAPAGRLPTTMYPADYVNEVEMTEMTLRPSANNPGRTYKWYDEAVLPFGFGLHYTTFKPNFTEGGIAGETYDISDLVDSCGDGYLDLCAFQNVSVSVQNAGNTTSDFVALAFLSGEHGPEPYPIKELAAYSRLRGVEAGETRNAVLGLTLGNLARVDGSGNTVLYPGVYELQLDIPTQDTFSFELSGDAKTLIQFPQPPANLGEGNGRP
jgi:beta-D-xylosidase 4